MKKRIKIICPKCDNTYEMTTGIPSRLVCQKCNCDNVIIQDGKEVEIKCLCVHCKKTFVLDCQVPVHVYHNIPNCKSYMIILCPEIPEAEKEIIVERPFLKSNVKVSAIVLCHNLLSMTLKCIEKLRLSTIRPEIILVDNGSGQEVKQYFENQSAEDLIYVRNEINLGCAVGRNQGAKWASGEYLFFLDNDQFVESKAIESLLDLKSDLAGAECWNIISLDGYSQKAYSPVTQTGYIGSGGLLIKRKVFEALKGYDERYAPAWYEDVDFCYRARMGKYSIACLPDKPKMIEHLCNQTSFSQKSFDINEAKITSQRLFVKTWSIYLQKRDFPKQGVFPFTSNPNPNPGKQIETKTRIRIGDGKKPSVLMFVDVLGWAWDNKTRQIVKYLSDDFDFKVLYLNELNQLDSLYADIYFTYEVNFFNYIKDCPGVKITGVTAHTYMNMNGWLKALTKADIIHANSQMLFNEINKYNSKTYYLPNGVDEELFAYSERDITKPFTVGYVGKNTKRKGLDLIQKACDEAKVYLKTQACRHNDINCLPHSKMPEFYKDIDVIAIASDMDGTPNQLLEAAASGRPAVANRIGNTPEFIIDEKNGWLVNDRMNISEYASYFLMLKEKRKTVQKAGVKARQTVEKEWTWKLQTEGYRLMFKEALI